MMRSSLPFKFALITLIVAGIGVLAISIFAYRDASSLMREQSILRLAENLAHLGQLFKGNIKHLRTEVKWLSTAKPTLNYIQTIADSERGRPSGPAINLLRQRLVTNFTNLLYKHPEYDQVRLIGRKNSGREIIRVERINGQIISTSEDNFQNKGARDYFKQAMRLKPGQQYISNIELNREHGKVSIPFQPVIRMASPVHTDNGAIFGIIIINVNFTQLTNIFKNPLKNVDYILSDEAGKFLHHSNSEKNFASERGGNASLFTEFSTLDWNLINPSQGQYKTFDVPGQAASLIVRHLHIDPMKQDRFLILTALASHFVIENESIGFGKRLMIGVLVVTIILAITIAFFTDRITAPIRLLTDAANRIAAGEENVQIPVIKQKDEFGVLANSFRTMVYKLSCSHDELRTALGKSEQENLTKSKFLTNMSHELRTPLNAILGFGEFLQFNPSEKLTKTQHEYSNHIITAGRHLLDLINDVLDLSKVEVDKNNLTLKNICLAAVIQECIDISLPGANQRNITISNNIKEGRHYIVRADITRLKQIIINLLSNASKYNIEGGSIKIEFERPNSKSVRIIIVDSGIGIPQQFHSRVFEAFDRLDAERADQVEGTGVGLTVTKILVEKMNGEIGFSSEEGKGSRFWFTLPTANEIEWSDNLNIGVETIDADHKILLALSNDASKNNLDAEFMGSLITELINYTKYHFQREEMIMQACEYPNYDEHFIQHRKLEERLHILADNWRHTRKTKEAKKLVSFLREWMTEHILINDVKIKPYVDMHKKDVAKSLKILAMNVGSQIKKPGQIRPGL